MHDNFFELGGNSLTATRAVARVLEEFAVEMPVRFVFETPTVATLGPRIESLQRESDAAALPPALVRQLRPSRLPLSYAQERLWLVDQIGLAGSAYNIPMAWHVQGPLNAGALERGLAELIQRHESLRTRFVLNDGEPAQLIDAPRANPLHCVDLTSLEEDARRQRIEQLLQEESTHAFNLTTGPVFRAALLRSSDREHVLLITLHHIVSDGWSQGILLRELTALYEAYAQSLPSPLSELPIQYADYALWERNSTRDAVLLQQLEYWKSRLRDAPPSLDLPIDRIRPAVASFEGGGIPFELSEDLWRDLHKLARRERVTLYMVLLAAFQVLLARWSGQSDIVVGSPVAGRRHRETEGLIGFFVNTLIMRSDLSGNPTFEGLLARVKETTLEAYAHQDLPFEKLVEELQPLRDLRRQPIFQVTFSFDNVPRASLRLADLETRSADTRHVRAKFDLTLFISEQSSGLRGVFEYASDLFERKTIERLAGHFSTLLHGIVARPQAQIGDLTLLSEAELHDLTVGGNATEADYPKSKCLHELFAEQAARTPEAAAVLHEDQQITYAQLDRRSNQLAGHLKSIGVGPDAIVGLYIGRSLDMVIGLLGILKAGGAYLPLEPDYPAARVALMLEDSRARVVVTHSRWLPQLANSSVTSVCLDQDGYSSHEYHAVRPDARVSPDNLAYVLYTSGTTGRPKAVMVEHCRVVNYVWAIRERLGIGSCSSYMLVQPLSVNSSVTVIYSALLLGGVLHVIDYETSLDAARLANYTARYRIDCLKIAPPHLQSLLESTRHTGILPRKLLVIGGDNSHWDWLAKLEGWLPQGCRIFNHYGATEATVGVTTYSVGSDAERGSTGGVPIGRALPNTRVYILDERLEPVPIGSVGELFLGGAQIVRGYLGRAGLTAERFIADPFTSVAGSRLYRTGDRARFLADGSVELLGRADSQVKIRGYRVERGEIAGVLMEHAAVRQAVVVTKRDSRGEGRLLAYVVLAEAARGAELRDYLAGRLPAYMVPSSVIVLEALPRTAHGKLDYNALPVPQIEIQVDSEPGTTTEQIVASVWCEALGVDRVGAQNNFFDLGGHSLLAMRVIGRLREILSLDLSLRTLFEAPTVRGLAERLEAGQRIGRRVIVPPSSVRPRPQPVPLSYAQERLWFLERMGLVQAAYNVPLSLHLDGKPDIRALQASVVELVRRHETLRTRFEVHAGEPEQVIDEPDGFRLELIDLSELEVAERRRRVERRIREETERPFNLEVDALFRTCLLRLGDLEHVLLITMHHIVSDGWSRAILVRELSALYRAFSQGRASPLSELPIQYADYALWQRSWLSGELLEQQIQYWKTRLAGAPPALELPTDRARPAVASFKGATVTFALSESLAAGLRNLARREGVTLYMVMLAAFQVLLSRWSGQKDIVVGSPIAGRMHYRAQGLIGFFVNMLVMRSDLSGNLTFKELLRQVKETTLGAYAHQDLPFEKLVEELHPARELSRQPVFQVAFTFLNAPPEPFELPGLTVKPVDGEHVTAKFDLMMAVLETPVGLSGVFEYATDLFERPTIERLADHFDRLLEGIVADVQRRCGELPLLSVSERHQLLVGWNAAQAKYPSHGTVAEPFAEHARRTPEALALVFEDQEIRYGELDRRASQLAHYLRAVGVGPDVRGRCVWSARWIGIGLLGILKAGGAYLPLDLQYPAERLAVMLSDSRAPGGGPLTRGSPRVHAARVTGAVWCVWIGSRRR